MNVDKGPASILKERYKDKDLRDIADRLSKASKEDWGPLIGKIEWLSSLTPTDEVFIEHARQDIEKLLKIAAIHQEFVTLVERMDTVSRNAIADRVLGNLLVELRKIGEKHS